MVLVSPGAQVTITDESFFSSAGPGTVPLIFIATKQDKLTSDGTAVAAGSTSVNADKLFLISSQRELLQTFGDPDFNIVGGLAQNGSPLNEYGLLAAYSYLGIANRAFVIRADIDLNELDPTAIAPTSAPANNTYWNNTNNLIPGLFVWDGTTWVVVSVTVLPTTVLIGEGDAEPSSGWADDVFILNVDATGQLQYMQRITGNWQIVGGSTWLGVGTNDFQWAPHTFVPTTQSDGSTALDTSSYWLKTTTPNSGLSIDLSHFDSTLAQFVSDTVVVSNNHLSYYARTGVASNTVTAGTVVGFVDSSDSFTTFSDEVAPSPQVGALADVVLERHNGGTTVVLTGTSAFTTQTNDAPTTFDIQTSGASAATTGDLDSATDIDELVILLNSDPALISNNVVASKSATDQLILTQTNGSDIIISAGTADVATNLFIIDQTVSNFALIASIEQDSTQPVGAVTGGTYWFDPSFIVDILVNTGAGVWDDFAGNIFIQPDDPINNTTGPSVGAGDLWIETDKLVNYPVIWRRNTGNTAWDLIDNTDQTTPLGVVFVDARPAPVTAGSGSGINNGGTGGDPDLDFDRPDPLLFPGGLLLFNTRFSGRNVKQWTINATFSDAGVTAVDRWVGVSGTKADGSLISGSDAQKQVIIERLAEVIISNQQIRDDTIFYNLLSAPGFLELIDEMLTLNIDRKEQAFVIGDSPFNLSDSTTDLQAWASNSNNSVGNSDLGLVSADSNLGVYYPSGLSTNTDGTEVVVPPSHMILRTIAFNDQVAYPWFAPAGFARGTVSNASAVGFLNSSDEFVVSSLGEGQRDVLQLNNVNPIASIPNRGLVVFGQKTRQATSSALDRINVARLINHVRFQAEQLAQPFLFEPNDSVTRGAVKEAYDAFLAEIVTLRGITDFLVVVDESNNTPARIDRNELWIDIAIQPVKSIEFIFIPIRLKSPGDDLNL